MGPLRDRGEVLVQHLECSGFVVMHKPPAKDGAHMAAYSNRATE